VKPAAFLITQKDYNLLHWFLEHNDNWLEVASSILSIKERYPEITKKRIHLILLMSKPWVNEAMFERIFEDLNGVGL